MAVGQKLNALSKMEPLTDLPVWQPSISIGIATFNTEIAGASELLKKADIAMYKAKMSGGGRVNRLI